MVAKKKKKPSTVARPPIVALMGHVDHGKTSLLSAIKGKDLTAREHGGISQHLTVTQVEHQKKKITFIDTPGHAAFVKMRSQGAQVTDLALLVIAANDGVKPQTKESLQHIKNQKLPFLVAINKIDLPEASVKKVKNQLSKENILVEEYGGQVVCVEVSAKQKKGLKELLDMILLVAEMEDLKVKTKAPFQGVVIDSRLDAQQGPTATIIVKSGNLKVGQEVFTNQTKDKIKAIIGEDQQRLKQAKLSQPVEVLGFKEVPPVGTIVKSQPLTTAQPTAEKQPVKSTAETAKSSETEEKEEVNQIKIILKTDTQGTLQALKANLPDEVELVLAGVGQVNESDILLAQSTQAQLIAFNVPVPSQIKRTAEMEKVTIKTYNVIYKLLEELEQKVLKMLEPTIDEEVTGEAEIIAEFNIQGNHIAGCKVHKGKVRKGDRTHLKRKGKIIADARIKSLEKERESVEMVKAGSEAGIVLKPDLDFKIGDVIISYKIER